VAAGRTLTTDNAELNVWPIDLVSGFVAQETGAVMRTLAGGYQIDDDLRITPPEELHLSFGAVQLDSEVATGIYNTVAGLDPAMDPLNRSRIERVIWMVHKGLAQYAVNHLGRPDHPAEDRVRGSHPKEPDPSSGHSTPITLRADDRRRRGALPDQSLAVVASRDDFAILPVRQRKSRCVHRP
jgi:hypothetical protein